MDAHTFAAAAAAAATASTAGVGIMSSGESTQSEVIGIEEASLRAKDADLCRLRASLCMDSRILRDENGSGFVIESDRVLCLGVATEDSSRSFFAAQLKPIIGWAALREAEEKLGLASFVHVTPTREAGSEFDVNVETVVELLSQASLMIFVLFSGPTVLIEGIKKMRFGFSIALGFGLSKRCESSIFNSHGHESLEPLLACASAVVTSVRWPNVNVLVPSMPRDLLDNECLRLYSRFSTLYQANQLTRARPSSTHTHGAVQYIEKEKVRAFNTTFATHAARVVYAPNVLLCQDELVHVTSWIYADAFLDQWKNESPREQDYDENEDYDSFWPTAAIGTKDSQMQVIIWLNDVSQLLDSQEAYQELIEQCVCL